MTTTTRKAMRTVAGAMLMAGTLYVLLAAPGLLSDRDSTTPARTDEARR